MAKAQGVDQEKLAGNEMLYTSVGVPQVLTDSNQEASGPLRVRFKGTRANVINDNDRLYPFAVLTDGVQRANDNYAKSGNMVGESPHPKVLKIVKGKVFFDTKLENSVIKIERVFMDGEETFLDTEVLETVKGKDLKALINAKVPVGISMRAGGSSITRVIDGKKVEVATFMDIQSFDVVMNPATEGCGVVQVLTDSQVADLMKEESFTDGVQIQNPVCPSCNSALNPVDPDGDGDIDFFECPSGCGIFFADTYLNSTVNASVELRRMSTTDYDRYSLAQKYLVAKIQNKNAVTDAVTKGGNVLNIDDLIKAIEENPAVRAVVTAIAAQTAKPALDAVEAQKVEDLKTKSRQDAQVFISEKAANLKGKLDDKAIKVITDAVAEGKPETKEQAQVIFDAVLKAINDSAAG